MSIARALASPRRSGAGVEAGRKSKFRPEIQGLRSLAVLMVVSYHVWFGRVSGGVDVFLLISAFLMTLQFVGKYEQGRPMALFKHWLHLFRRLLPAAVTVIIAVLAASSLFLPRTRWLSIISEGWASLFYFENRLLQSQATDYYATDHSGASPFQHFWSLSIQGQVFILWPLIFAAAALVAKRYRLHYRILLVYIFAGVFTVSLVYSIIFTLTNQAQAYFDTGARLWEFALGTLVALILPGLRIPRTGRIALGWLGIAAMLSCGILINVQGAFPGVAALWPTLAAAGVIAAGQTGSRVGVDRILSAGPLVRLGDISYALYLWHWPILVIALAATGRDHAGPLSGTVIIVVSMMLAYLTTRFIEKPWREWKWPEVNRRRALVSIALVLTLAAGSLGGARYAIQLQADAALAQAEYNNPGARSLMPGYSGTAAADAVLLPDLADVSSDWADFPGGCEGFHDPNGIRCSNGDVESPTKTIVVWGSSHAGVWATPVMELAKRYNWSVVSYVKALCPVTEGADPTIPEDCVDFNKAVSAEFAKIKPDLIFTTSTRVSHGEPRTEFMDPGWARMLEAAAGSTIPVVSVRDTPRFTGSVPECLARHADDEAACAMPRTDAYPGESPANAYPNVKNLDFSDYFCPGDTCPAVIGNIIAYLDDNHPTATYMKTLAPIFEERFMAVTGWKEQ
ncbi:acyltransferase [Arthrobacter sp. SPG23]|uniref:acyltransferase family protein n=1 Tax=Arthrobacter sp. SPG23 TaxID=1610703 RepID=UPI0005BDAB71|nr:acyltransferase family protein [Arthrobacter sp. SPG23]KIS26573.1 acyltransferase [Arthrobacter sp. SPG23]